MLVITLSAVAILIRRLGMTWSVFEPSNSLLQAAGRGMVVSSIKVPAVGIILEFNRAEKRSYEVPQAELYIPGRSIDALGFGLIQPWFRDDDDNRYMRIGTSDEYTETILVYCNRPLVRQETRELIRSKALTRCFADFVGLTAPVMFIKGTKVKRIPDPSPNSLGILNSNSASLVFQERIFGYTSEHQHDMPDKDLRHLQRIQNLWFDLSELRAWEPNWLRSTTNIEDQTLLNTLGDTLKELDSWLCTNLPNPDYRILLVNTLQWPSLVKRG